MRWNSLMGTSFLGAGLAALALLGADTPPARKAPPKVPSEEILNDVADIRAADNLMVEGVGLVIGLDNTGSDPEPSPDRTKLLDEMRKAGVAKPNELLTSKWVSLVRVRASVPAGVDSTDRFDVEVSLTPASTTTSLAGGYLLLTDLTENMIARGEVKEGQVMARAHGPVMLGSAAKADDPRSGRVLEGGRVLKPLPFLLQLRDERKSYYASKLLETTINRRFHSRQGVDQKGMAVAKTDSRLLLKVPQVYHQNQKRYFQIVKLLPVNSAPEQVEARMAKWSQELLDPETAGVSALRLEGIGPNAIPALKAGLDNPDPKVRFFSAEALAYLNDPAGAEILAEAAGNDPDFRIFALTAMAAMDQPAGVLRLRKLMDHPDLNVRYGAFSALRAADETSPYLGRVQLVDLPEEQVEEGTGDAMALRLSPSLSASKRRRGPPPEDPFALYVVDSEGPPSIHVSKSRRCEIVLFGRGVELLPPLVLGGASSIQINASEVDRKVEISRIEPNQRDRPDQKVTVSPAVAAVVRELVRMRATYPDIVSLLESAHAQKNLPGPLVVDALPAPSPKYQESQLAGAAAFAGKKDEAVGRTSAEAAAKSKRRWLPTMPTKPRPTRSVRDWFNRPKSER